MDTGIPPMIDNKESLSTTTAAKESRDFQGLTMDEDVSLLRQPMRTALAGFLEAKKAYENGTDEVRRLLLHECSLIYECNVCRNMFRSLVNFISHKRIYCKLSSEGNYRSYSDHNSSLIIQTEQRPPPWMNKSRSTGSSPIPTKSSTRDLSKIIERLKRVDVSSSEKMSKAETMHNQMQAQHILADAATQQNQEQPQIPSFTTSSLQQQPIQTCLVGPEPVLQLESVPTSTQAVYQTLNPLHAADSIRTEVDEVHNLLINQQNTMLGPDGKAIAPNEGFLNHHSDGFGSETPTLTALLREIKKPLIPSGDALQQTVQQIACEMCPMTFQTEKTLNIHIQKKHTSSTYVFQCPTCSLTFLQPAAVIRHLANEHKKPLKRIRKMRDSIFKKRIQIGDVQAKGPSRELKRLQLDSTKDMENGHGIDAARLRQQNGKPLSTCSHCQKTFEKRAAFVTHLANCSAKNKPPVKDQGSSSVKEEVQSKIRVATREEIQTKLKNQNTNLAKTLIENQNIPKGDIKNVEPTTTNNDGQTAMAAMRMLPKPAANEPEIKSYDFDFLSHSLNKVNIKQEPQEEEFNSTSTQATTGSDINEMFENLERQTFGKGLQVVSLDLMVATGEKEKQDEDDDDKSDSSIQSKEAEEEQQHIKENLVNDTLNGMKSEQVLTEDPLEEPLKPLTENVGQKKKQKGFRIVPASKQLTCRCKICNKQFNALSNLRRHISMFHYRARRFGCNLCDYRAFRRYDIVNHLTFVHKMQGERESMAIEFVTMHEIPYSKDDVEHDIVVVHEAGENLKIEENGVKTYENKTKRKSKGDSEDKMDTDEPLSALDQMSPPETSLPKAVRKRLRKALSQQEDSGGGGGQKRPIRNRIKPVNNDFVYDLSTLKEEPKDAVTRLTLKRRNTMGLLEANGSKHSTSPAELTPPIKITPYRLRTEPLIPANKEIIKGSAARTYRNAVHEALAAPSTLPELPTERPQMRPRLSLASRNDSTTAPVIEATELEVARLESTFFDDSFLEKFAKKSNPSFKMKPLLALQHSRLNSILQKFENNTIKSLSGSTEESITKLQENGIENATENNVTTPNTHPIQDSTSPEYTQQDPLHSLSEEMLEQMDASPPNGQHIMEPSSPPSTPRKRITLMQRLAENRAKRRDTLIRNALDD